jgi:trans-aconitate 2-methyltransferase
MWDPGQYRRFAAERARPFFDLLAQAQVTDPRLVADLGCGPGDLTATLAQRWPAATVIGVDNSAAMIEAASGGPAGGASGGAPGGPAGQRLSFVLADIRDWAPERPADVIVSNAVLQWVPGHLDLLARWAGMLAEGGWLGIQVPGNYDQPSHAVLRELTQSPRWRPLLDGVALNRQAADPGDYLDVLSAAGCAADVWETTYFHVLPGEDPVIEWYKGTGLRPVLNALTPALAGEFVAEYGARMREAYPARPHGTVFPFRRVFATGRR